MIPPLRREERERRSEKGGKSACVNREPYEGPARDEEEDYLGCIQGRCRHMDVRLPWRRKFKLRSREAGPTHHYDDKMDSDQ